MADVIRGRKSAFGWHAIAGYLFHGATAVLTLWLLTRALQG